MFSFKFAYYVNLEDSVEVPNQKWQVVWKFRVPERVRVFMWKVLHGRIITNSLHARRGIIDDASCKACGVVEESLLHVLRDCFLAKRIWNKLLSMNVKYQFFTLQEGEWVENNILRGRNIVLDSGLCWDILFVLSCWWL